jgi:hypothetical protein
VVVDGKIGLIGKPSLAEIECRGKEAAMMETILLKG